MADRLCVKPSREGLLVPDPDRGVYLQSGGAYVPATPYWARRLKDGDVVEIDQPEREPAAKK
jgi:hypothetical protein